ncbi:MAG: hypothetical protein IKE41_00060, partial [Clostridia bacterium]|nr:hypothetical protein [Clostridia bacterium]
LFTVIFVLVVGAIAFDIDKALMEQQVIGIISAIVNSILDIGLVLWKFTSGINSCDEIVKTEDLRSVVDKNDLLTQYCDKNQIEYKEELENVEKTEIKKAV